MTGAWRRTALTVLLISGIALLSASIAGEINAWVGGALGGFLLGAYVGVTQ